MDSNLKSCPDLHLPNEQTVAKALAYLASSDESHAQAKKRLEGLKKAEKVVLAGEYIAQKDLAEVKVTENHLNHLIFSSEPYKQWLDNYQDAIADLTLLSNKRDRAELVLEFWRSLNSARSKGVMV